MLTLDTEVLTFVPEFYTSETDFDGCDDEVQTAVTNLFEIGGFYGAAGIVSESFGVVGFVFVV